MTSEAGTSCSGCRRARGSEGLNTEGGVAVSGLQANLSVVRPDAGDTVI